MGFVDGYLAEISVQPGDEVVLHLSSDQPVEVDVDLVRIHHADLDPAGPGVQVTEVDPDSTIGLEVVPQRTSRGSYFEVKDAGVDILPSTGQVLWALVHPTLLSDEDQVVISWSTDGGELALLIDRSGRPTLASSSGRIVATRPLALNSWYAIVVRLGAAAVVLEHRLVDNPFTGRFGTHFFDRSTDRVEGVIALPRMGPGLDMRIGAGGSGLIVESPFTGKIGPVGMGHMALDVKAAIVDPLGDHEDVVAHWVPGPDSERRAMVLNDRGAGGHHASPVNMPVGNVTGPLWSGDWDDPTLEPAGYGAFRYSADAVIDCGWDPTCRVSLPGHLESGVYGLDVNSPSGRVLFAFVVRAAVPVAKIVVVIPTMSYMAEGGRRPGTVHPAVSLPIHGGLPTSFRDYGGSTLDRGSDDRGICFSSRLRPLAELSPTCRSQDLPMAGRFGTDVSLLAFLEAGGHSADVITDEDLDRDGVSALAPYRVAITGSFPAYASRAMLDAWEGYSSGGGRILYLGGGGFYWLTSYGSDRTVVEVRRGESGTRTWQAEPGEYDHATSGERCGLWRSKGRAPQKVFGVGLAATGRSAGIPYRRMPDSYHRSVAWVFDGVGDDLLGLKALCPGGVAGMEVDRYDRLLGSPPHARILASAIGLPNDYMKVSEEILFNHPGLSGGEDHQVRADMVLFTTRNGGAVFSAGSSAWISGLPVNDFDNPVAQITRNILDAFVARGRLRGSRFDDEDDLTGGGPQDHVDSGPH